MKRHNSQWLQFFRKFCQFHWFPLLLGMSATIAVFGMWQQLLRQEHQHIQQLVQQEAEGIASELNRELSRRIVSLERMASRWRVTGGTPQEFWEADATDYIGRVYGYQAIEWVDPAFRVRWIVPLKGNEAAQNFNLYQEQRRQVTLSVAKELRQTLLTRTISLVQGGKGFLACVPLFVQTTQQPELERFDGFIVGVFRFDDFFGSVLTASPRYQVQIFGQDGLIYSQGSQPSPSSEPHQVVVQAYSADWRVQVTPTSVLIAEGRSPLPTLVLWGGLAGVWTLVCVATLGQRFARQARHTKEINQQLHAEISQRQQAEARLQESEERLQLALEASAEGWWDWDIMTGVVKRSPQYLHLLGYEVGEFPDDVNSWETSIYPDDLSRLMERLTAHLQDSSVSYACEYRIQAKSGGWQWISDYGKVVTRDATNQPLRMIGTFKDITDRKRTEIALAASQQRYQNLVETSPDIIERFDLQLRHLYVSPALARITGIASEAFLGKTCRELGMDENMVATWEAAAAQLLSTGQKQVIEFSAPTLQGVRSFEMAIAPDISDQGVIESILCISRDITERQQAALALQESEARFQAFMNHSPTAAWITDANGRMLYASGTYCRIFQLPTPDVVGQSIFDLYPAKVANQFLDHIQTVVQTQQVLEAIEIAPRQDGTMGDFLVYKFPIPDASGQPLIGGVAIDVTQQHQAEADLRHQKEMFQAIVDHIPVMVALFNQQGQMEFINPELARCLGWSIAEWQHQDVIAACYPDPTYRQRVLEHMLAATGDWKDFTTINADGQSLETTWANVRLSGGRFLGIGQDISDRKRKEMALRQAMEAAEAANVAKSMFLANMSHELRTPLNVILGFTQVMAHDASLTASQKEDLQTIRRSGDHLLSLINDVLDLSKIEAGHCTLAETGFDLISLLHGLRTMMAERAHSKRLQLIFDIAPNVAQFVIADEQKLRQILLNLLSNAIKFTQQGSVTLRVTSQETPVQADVSLQPSPAIGDLNHHTLHPIYTLKFVVTDTGVGIATTEQATIFDAFVQADAGKKSISGTGLGLTISRKLLELMQGTIAVHSLPNVGSTFTVTVPVRPVSGVDASSELHDRTVIGLVPGQPHRRVLVVDDQRENRLLMVRLLSQLGLQVREATNGQEAVQIWQEWRPDLTWMDIRMPILDGYEATKQIRSIDQDQASIIIALTAQASQSDRTLALAAGCNDYISKPFREETVFLKMAEYLGLEYLYTSPHSRSIAPPIPSPISEPDLSTLLEPGLLAQLAPDWLNALEDAAICGSDQAIVKLTTQLAPEFAPLRTYLVNLADQFEFEQIIRWVNHNSQRGDHGGSA